MIQILYWSAITTGVKKTEYYYFIIITASITRLLAGYY